MQCRQVGIVSDAVSTGASCDCMTLCFQQVRNMCAVLCAVGGLLGVIISAVGRV